MSTNCSTTARAFEIEYKPDLLGLCRDMLGLAVPYLSAAEMAEEDWQVVIQAAFDRQAMLVRQRGEVATLIRVLEMRGSR